MTEGKLGNMALLYLPTKKSRFFAVLGALIVLQFGAYYVYQLQYFQEQAEGLRWVLKREIHFSPFEGFVREWRLFLTFLIASLSATLYANLYYKPQKPLFQPGSPKDVLNWSYSILFFGLLLITALDWKPTMAGSEAYITFWVATLLLLLIVRAAIIRAGANRGA